MGARASQADRILLQATMSCLADARERPEHPDHAGAWTLFHSTLKGTRSRYTSGAQFAEDPGTFLQVTPHCARFLREELRQALDPRVTDIAAPRQAVLTRWLGAAVVAREWPTPPVFVSGSAYHRLKNIDNIDRLALEIINLRASATYSMHYQLWAAADVRVRLHALLAEDPAVRAFVVELWGRIVQYFIPRRRDFEPWIVRHGDEHAPYQMLDATEVDEIYVFEPMHGDPLQTRATHASSKKK